MTHEPDRTLPSIWGIAVTDVNAVLGAILWVGLVVGVGLGAIERALALAPLVLVPLGLGLAATPRFDGLAGKLYHQYRRGTSERCHRTPNT